MRWDELKVKYTRRQITHWRKYIYISCKKMFNLLNIEWQSIDTVERILSTYQLSVTLTFSLQQSIWPKCECFILNQWLTIYTHTHTKNSLRKILFYNCTFNNLFKKKKTQKKQKKKKWKWKLVTDNTQQMLKQKKINIGWTFWLWVKWWEKILKKHLHDTHIYYEMKNNLNQIPNIFN